jgi:uncharacterized protein YejL (UPF0352 family)
MENQQLISELVEILKKHAKKPEDATTEAEKAAIRYFTDDKIEDMAAELIEILKQHSK